MFSIGRVALVIFKMKNVLSQGPLGKDDKILSTVIFKRMSDIHIHHYENYYH